VSHKTIIHFVQQTVSEHKHKHKQSKTCMQSGNQSKHRESNVKSLCDCQLSRKLNG